MKANSIAATPRRSAMTPPSFLIAFGSHPAVIGCFPIVSIPRPAFGLSIDQSSNGSFCQVTLEKSSVLPPFRFDIDLRMKSVITGQR